jgi:hypothetical protein
MRRTFAFTLLSLFTTEQRAAEIEGDLIEEREYRGRWWFMINAIGTALALFNHSYRQAPLRITALGAAGTFLSVVACSLLDRVFFAPDAFVPVPFLGFIAIPASAFLTGLSLGYSSSESGIRAAAVTTILLTILFMLAQIFSRTSDVVLEVELVVAALYALLSTLGAFALSVVIFLGPLMAGAVCGSRRCFRSNSSST